jgi:hypothetical protein
MGIEARERCPGQIAAPVAPTSINKDEIIGECQRRLYVLVRVTDLPTAIWRSSRRYQKCIN